MTFANIELLVAGLILLVVGADWLVKGASKLASAFGITPLIIGLTVVAYGTSAPEMAVSVSSAFKGQADLALGNVVGSNIFNVLFILGIAAMVTPLIVNKQLVRLDVPVMIAASILLFAIGYDGVIGKIDGVLLFSGAVGYTLFLTTQAEVFGMLGAFTVFSREIFLIFYRSGRLAALSRTGLVAGLVSGHGKPRRAPWWRPPFSGSGFCFFRG